MIECDKLLGWTKHCAYAKLHNHNLLYQPKLVLEELGPDQDE